MRGSWRKDRHDKKDIMQIEESPIVKPEWLDGEAGLEWDRITKVLEPSKVLTPADQMIVANYCILSQELIEKKGEMPVNKMGLLRSCLTDLGLSPVARTKITLPAQKKAEKYEDEF